MSTMPNKLPKVSVIVPVYNTEKWLARCIDSILAQTFTNFELLLINDGSTDSSGAICDEYAEKDSRIRVFHKPNGGVSSARNLGLDNATGEWITFCDADDWVENNYIYDLIMKAEETDADIVMCNLLFRFAERDDIYKIYNWKDSKISGLANYISQQWTPLVGSIHKKKLYEKFKLRLPDNISLCEDFHLMVRLCFYASKISTISAPTYNYRQQPNSIVHNLNNKSVEEQLWAYNDILKFAEKAEFASKIKKCMTHRVLCCIQDYLLNPIKFKRFRDEIIDKKDYITSCPYLSKKQKVSAWCIVHHLGFISLFLAKIYLFFQQEDT